MALQVPLLDDRTFEDLVQSARERLPQVAPDWTDHNLHDPGITLVELFAWLADMQLYRLDTCPDRSREAFLRLMALERRPADAAHVAIWPNAQRPPHAQVVKPGEPVIAVGQDHLIFETASAFALKTARIADVTTRAGGLTTEQTRANHAVDIDFFAFGPDAEEGASLELAIEGALQTPLLPGEAANQAYAEEARRLRLWFDLETAHLMTPGRHLEESPSVRPSVQLAWELYAASGWQPLASEDGTRQLTRSGSVTLDGVPMSADGQARTYLRCRIAGGRYEIAPRVRAVGLNVIEARQLQHAVEHDVGAGRPYQVVQLSELDAPSASRLFRDPLTESLSLRELSKRAGIAKGDVLRHVLDHDIPSFRTDGRLRVLQPVIARACLGGLDAEAGERLLHPPELTVEVLEDSGVWQAWLQVEDFEQAGPDDRQFQLDDTRSRISFGNGLNGRLPGEGSAIRVAYLTCQGLDGNVAAAHEWRFVRGSPGGVYGTNPRAARGGQPRESLADAESRARRSLRVPSRAVTRTDTEHIARSTPGLRVARARVFPNYDVRWPCARAPGLTTVVVASVQRPIRAGKRSAESPAFLETVQRHVDRHRLLGEDLRVVGPRYVGIAVHARLRLKPRANARAVERGALLALNEFLAPVDARTDPIGGWAFGRDVYVSEITDVLDGVEGVDAVFDVRLAADDKEPVAETVELPTTGLAFPGLHALVVHEGDAAARGRVQ